MIIKVEGLVIWDHFSKEEYLWVQHSFVTKGISIASASVYLRASAFEITSDSKIITYGSTFLINRSQVVRAGVSVTWNVLSWSGNPVRSNMGCVVAYTSVLSRTWSKKYLYLTGKLIHRPNLLDTGTCIWMLIPTFLRRKTAISTWIMIWYFSITNNKKRNDGLIVVNDKRC